MLKRIRNFFSLEARARKIADVIVKDMQVQMGQVLRTPGPGWETVWGEGKPAADQIWGSMTDRDRERVVRIHALVYACVQIIVNGFNEAVIQAGTQDQDGEFTPFTTTHWAVRLLRDEPNPWMDGLDFFAYENAHLQLTGKSFVWKWFNGFGQPSELWPIPTSWVKPVLAGPIKAGSRQRVVSHYEVTPPGAEKPFPVPADQMIYSRIPDPNSFHDGVGPLQACFRNYRLDTEKDNYIIELFTNTPTPGLVVRQQHEFDEDAKTEMRDLLIERVGRGNRGGPLFVFGENAGVEAIAPLSDMDFPGLTAVNESAICGAFGVPPLLAHARVGQENSPLSSPNVEAADYIFATRKLIPMWNSCASRYKRGLLVHDPASRGIVLKFDTSPVRALRVDMDEMADVLMKAGTYVQINEGRRLLGLKPDPRLEGKYAMPMNVIIFDPDQDMDMFRDDPAATGDEQAAGVDEQTQDGDEPETADSEQEPATTQGDDE